MILSFQLLIQASNGRTPELTANVTATVSIVRDNSRPTFLNLPYNDASVSENAAVGYEFYGKVQAETRNLQVCCLILYSLATFPTYYLSPKM